MTEHHSTGWPRDFRPKQVKIKLVHTYAFGFRPMGKGFVELELVQEMNAPNGPAYRRLAMMILAPQEALDLSRVLQEMHDEKFVYPGGEG